MLTRLEELPGHLQMHDRYELVGLERPYCCDLPNSSGRPWEASDTPGDYYQESTTNHRSFSSHITDAHLLLDAYHYQAWKLYVVEKLTDTGLELRNSATAKLDTLIWKAWQFVLLGLDALKLEFCCPICEAVEYIDRDRPMRHHLNLLADDDSIRPYRWSILALYPDFVSHPIFNDELPRSVDRIQEFHLRKITPGVQKAASTETRGRSELSTETATTAGDFLFTASEPRLAYPNENERVPRWHSLSETFEIGAQFGSSPFFFGSTRPVLESGRASMQVDFESLGSYPLPFDNGMDRGGSLSSAHPTSWSSTLDVEAAQTGAGPRDLGNTSRTSSSAQGDDTIIGSRYMCPDCPNGYFKKSALKLHQKVHMAASDRPHPCPDCNKRWLYPKDVARHRRRIHGHAT
ncbi:hypothetical protein LTR42_002753 [Elasticomyces elasticus]|nr:hypothetical protein LTR42_002753 [Elasticomyces elasticus]